MFEKKVFIIAEAGVNHNGEVDLAFELSQRALDAGADAIKFQVFNAKNLVQKNLKTVAYQNGNRYGNSNQYDMLKKLELSKKQFYKIKKFCDKIGIEFMASPFDCESLKFLKNLQVKRIKISSGEITNGPLVWKAAKSKLHLIISTGMATKKEIKICLSTVQHALNNFSEPSSLDEIKNSFHKIKSFHKLKKKVSLLHCTSQYPTPFEDINLNVIKSLKKEFGLNVGLSDHSKGILVSPASIAFGSKIIEKHITLDKKMTGPDHSSSIEPGEFTEMVKNIKIIYNALGSKTIRKLKTEDEIAKKSRQKIIAIKNINKGQIISKHDLGTIRSINGKVGNFIWDYVGERSKKNFKAGQVIK